mmetsp:Transcript_149428/g.261039  ORF Transcript_149428/g.261039 Transcript_149428/m.261039 type:complete len:203 (+) Transcript_149428:150-758(+)
MGYGWTGNCKVANYDAGSQADTQMHAFPAQMQPRCDIECTDVLVPRCGNTSKVRFLSSVCTIWLCTLTYLAWLLLVTIFVHRVDFHPFSATFSTFGFTPPLGIPNSVNAHAPSPPAPAFCKVRSTNGAALVCPRVWDSATPLKHSMGVSGPEKINHRAALLHAPCPHYPSQPDPDFSFTGSSLVAIDRGCGYLWINSQSMNI